MLAFFFVVVVFMKNSNALMSFICSKILLSKQKIIDLFPKIERKLDSIKEADSTVMQMQIKRQREFWHLLKIACVSHMLLISQGQICL